MSTPSLVQHGIIAYLESANKCGAIRQRMPRSRVLPGPRFWGDIVDACELLVDHRVDNPLCDPGRGTRLPQRCRLAVCGSCGHISARIRRCPTLFGTPLMRRRFGLRGGIGRDVGLRRCIVVVIGCGLRAALRNAWKTASREGQILGRGGDMGIYMVERLLDWSSTSAGRLSASWNMG